jgi:hypothetical protein
MMQVNENNEWRLMMATKGYSTQQKIGNILLSAWIRGSITMLLWSGSVH